MQDVGRALRESGPHFIPTRQTLLSRLRDLSDKESWEDFFNTYWRLIYRVAVSAGLTKAEAEDVVQKTMIRVSEKMPAFRYDPTHGSFRNWLLKITSHFIAEELRNRPKAVPFSELDALHPTHPSTIERIPDPASIDLEAFWDKEWEANQLDVVLRRLKTRVNPKHYQVFDLFVLKQWSAKKVSKALRINSAYVYMIKLRLSHLLRKERQRLERGQNQALDFPLSGSPGKT